MFLSYFPEFTNVSLIQTIRELAIPNLEFYEPGNKDSKRTVVCLTNIKLFFTKTDTREDVDQMVAKLVECGLVVVDRDPYTIVKGRKVYFKDRVIMSG